MSEAHVFEITLAYPASTTQLRPPDANYSRDNVMRSGGKHEIAASSPSAFGGNDARYNPEELMLMSLSECHMLTYLAIAAKKQITIVRYEDRATGQLGIGRIGEFGVAGKTSMQRVTLHPRVTVAKGTNLEDARAIHVKAHANCFMANSVNFPITAEPEMIEASA
jgi:organic hydroperoxide reductase OsmC/OhrA